MSSIYSQQQRSIYSPQSIQQNQIQEIQQQEYIVQQRQQRSRRMFRRRVPIFMRRGPFNRGGYRPPMPMEYVKEPRYVEYGRRQVQGNGLPRTIVISKKVMEESKNYSPVVNVYMSLGSEQVGTNTSMDLSNLPKAPLAYSPPLHQTTIKPVVKSFPEIVDEQVNKPVMWIENKIVQPLKKTSIEAVRRRDINMAYYAALGLTAVRFGEGFYEGITSIFRPWTWVEGIATIARNPIGVAETFIEDPTQAARVAGAFTAGYAMGKIGGKIYGYVKTRNARPEIFELVPEKETITPLYRGVKGTVKSYRVYVYKIYEKGRAVKVPQQVINEEGLIGKASYYRLVKKPYTYESILYIRQPGKPWIILKYKPSENLGKAILGSNEFAESKLYKVYGVSKNGPPKIYYYESLKYEKIPVNFRKEIGYIKVKVKYPSYLKRMAYRIGRAIRVTRKTPKPKIMYELKGYGLGGHYIGKGESGTVPANILLNKYVKPLTRISIKPTVEYSFPEFGFLTPLALIKGKKIKTYSIPKPLNKISNIPKNYFPLNNKNYRRNIKPKKWTQEYFREYTRIRRLTRQRQYIAQPSLTQKTETRLRARFRFLTPIQVKTKNVRRNKAKNRHKTRYYERVNPFNI